ncbi:hypothetical protein BJY04DRAFT_176317 [Aspergillus karnatakaensis]|uniref:uncharacterized protein n=1 Tax=Aspergillus karnatakaensis TaxID=1810916 RepID=UPI003CCCF743
MATTTSVGSIQVQALKPTVPLLDQRFVDVKKSLVSSENKKRVIDSYNNICAALKDEVAFIEKTGPKMVPEIDFNEVVSNGWSRNRSNLPEVCAESSFHRRQTS